MARYYAMGAIPVFIIAVGVILVLILVAVYQHLEQ